MSKRKPLDKAEARERRNRMLESAAAARLSLTEGVREMRAIAGMTQEEFARHRGVSARVIKAIELGQANPTVATMNQIGEFFGLEVAFVPIQRDSHAVDQQQPTGHGVVTLNLDEIYAEASRVARMATDQFVRTLNEKVAELDAELNVVRRRRKTPEGAPASSSPSASPSEDTAAGAARGRTQRKPRPT